MDPLNLSEAIKRTVQQVHVLDDKCGSDPSPVMTVLRAVLMEQLCSLLEVEQRYFNGGQMVDVRAAPRLTAIQ